MGETVRVVVRCRPMNRREKDLNCESVVEMNPATMQCILTNPAEPKAPPKMFTFDGVYSPDSNTEQMYNDVAYSLVESVTEGYNGTVFAYGQTGCGKSFTMAGIPDPPNQRGIIPRAFEHIFETTSLATDKKFLVAISYLEIYNEEIRDLLGKDSNKKLEMKEHPEKGVFVAGLSLHTVSSYEECERWLESGAVNRHTGATLMNADSSRSHSVFTCQVEAIDKDDSGEEHLRVGKLNLVDLAGSERQSKTGAMGDRLKEATKINLSLSALGNVISALVDGKSKHIPYRDSKLTRLLQDSLGGNTKTLMIAAVSPADNNYDETLSTLRYANRAKNIKNKPRINEDPKDALLRQYQEEVNRLKALLEGRGPTEVTSYSGGDSDDKVQELEGKLAEMQRMFEEERSSRDRLEKEIMRLRNTDADTAVTTSDGGYGYDGMISEDGSEPIQQRPVLDEDGNVIGMVPVPPTTPSAPKMRPVLDADGNVVGMAPVPAKMRPVLDQDGNVVGMAPMPTTPSTPPKQRPILDESGNVIGMAPAAPGVPSRSRVVTSSTDMQTEPLMMGDESGMVTTEDSSRISSSAAASGEAVVPGGRPQKMNPSQVAVHLQSVAMAAGKPAAVKPSATVAANNAATVVATNDGRGDDITDVDLQKEREIALQRLQELQGKMVGGESTQNTELRAKHETKRKAAEDRRRKVAEALANATDEDIMVGIYEDLHDEIRVNAKQTVKEKQNVEALVREINDIQSEFQTERADYLDTIRKHEREIKYMNALVMKMQPLIRRECNYYNIDRVRSQAKWNEEDQNWILPAVLMPSAGVGPAQNPGDSYNGNGFAPGPSGVVGLPNVSTVQAVPSGANDEFEVKDEEYRRHLEERIAASSSYSEKWKQSRRREAILQEARVTQQLGADVRLAKPPSRLEPLSSRQTSALGVPPKTGSRRF